MPQCHDLSRTDRMNPRTAPTVRLSTDPNAATRHAHFITHVHSSLHDDVWSSIRRRGVAGGIGNDMSGGFPSVRFDV